MSDEQPTLARRSFGAYIRRLRIERGLTPREVAEAIGYKRDAIRRMENGEQGVKFLVAKGLCDFFGVTGSEKSHLCALALRSKERGWWESYLDGATGVPTSPAIPLFLETEQEATHIRVVETELIPGLLQTHAYLCELQALYPVIPPEVAVSIRDLRAHRQRLMFDRGTLPRIEFVIGKNAIDYLLRLESAVADEQIKRLLEVAGFPSMEIRVITALHPAPAGAFTILTPRDEFASFVYLESLDGCRYVERPAVVSYYEQTFAAVLPKTVLIEEYLR